MGLATSMDALHQGLPKSALSLLQTRKFQMQQSNECLTAIVEDLFIHANVGLMVGPLPLKQLIDQFMHYNFSVGGFVSNLKVSIGDLQAFEVALYTLIIADSFPYLG